MNRRRSGNNMKAPAMKNFLQALANGLATGLAIGGSTLLLVSCGGGGGDAGRPVPTVTLSSTSSAKYSETLNITLSGRDLDQPLGFASNACRNFALSTTQTSTSTTGYYTCTVSGGTGAQAITVTAGGVTVATVNFTVPVPEVTMVVSNGTTVNPGTLVMRLNPDKAPITVDNFLAYVKSGFYSNVAFHRHGRNDDSSTFVLQSGGYDAPLTAAAAFPAHKTTNAPIALEVGRGLSNVRYSLAMARTNVLNSATSEFFINTADNVFLDTSSGGYAVFGNIVTGTTVVDQMVAAPCSLSPVNFGNASTDCLPVPNLVILSALQTK